MMQQRAQAGTTGERRKNGTVDLVRWDWLAAILAGVAFVVEGVIYLIEPGRLQEPVLLAGYILVAIGLAGFHALQKDKAGRLGQAGFYLSVAGSVAAAVAVSGSLIAGLDLELLHGVGFLLMIVGYLLYGTATLRAKVLPRWYGVTFLLTWPLAIAAGEYTVFVVGVIWMALGYALRWRVDASPARQQTVSELASS
ncbi:hypothetical protein BH24CHL1_BH24CHL1_02730 [soil metagenome]